eukprot:gene949-1031_t
MVKFLKPNAPSTTPSKSGGATAPSSSSSSTTPVLSKSVMSMKFMKRKESVDQPEGDRLLHLQGGDWMKDSRTAERVPVHSAGGLHCVRDFADLYAALPGRRSFGGANKAMERYYQSVVADKYKEKVKKESDKDVIDDEEMVRRYQQLVGLPRGPNQGKRPVSAANNNKNKNKRERENEKSQSSAKKPKQR